MLHAYVQKFDVMGTVEIFLGTKYGHSGVNMQYNNTENQEEYQRERKRTARRYQTNSCELRSRLTCILMKCQAMRTKNTSGQSFLFTRKKKRVFC